VALQLLKFKPTTAEVEGMKSPIGGTGVFEGIRGRPRGVIPPRRKECNRHPGVHAARCVCERVRGSREGVKSPIGGTGVF